MLWAASCTGFFGFPQSDEFTCPPIQAFNSRMLTPQDITVNSHQVPIILSIHLQHTKNDPYGNGITIHLGRTGQTICPVSVILDYLARRGMVMGPLFLFRDGSSLSWQRLVSHVWHALVQHGIDSSNYHGHSFRIGAATAVAQAGLEDSLIQTLGRWHSSAYTKYICTPGHIQAAASSQLLGNDHTLEQGNDLQL